MQHQPTIPQHTLGKSILLHLFPGLGVFLFFLATSEWFLAQGFKSSFSVLLGFLLVGIPIQLGVMLKEAKRLHGKTSLKAVISYTKKLPVWFYLVLTIIFIGYALIISSVMSPFNEYLKSNFFAWLPDWFVISSAFEGKKTSIQLIISLLALVLIDGLVNPIIEEIYFRGFLMPAIERFKYWSAVINAVLFSLAHLWQPWNMLQIFFLVVPVYLLVYRKKSIYIAIVLHCTANLIGALLTIGQFLQYG